MTRSWWCHWFGPRWKWRRHMLRGPGGPNTPAGFRPALERLEDRTCPSVNLGFAFPIGGPGSEIYAAVTTDTSGNLYVTGYFMGTVDFDPGPGIFNLTSNSGADGVDTFVAKYSAAGEFVWARDIRGNNAAGRGIVMDGGGNLYVAGEDSSGAFVVKVGPNGNTVWVDTLPEAIGITGTAIALDSAGNVYATGNFAGTVDFDPGPGTYDLTTGNSGVYVWKLNSNGNLVWARASTGGFARGWDIAVDSSDNLHMSGDFKGTVNFDPAGSFVLTSTGSDVNPFIWSLDQNGNFVSARSFPLVGSDFAVAPDSAGNIFTTYTIGSEIFISKLDSVGNVVWSHVLENTAGSYSGLALDRAGNLYVAASFTGTTDFNTGPSAFQLTSAGGWDVFVAKYDSNGDFDWAVHQGGSGNDAYSSSEPIALGPGGAIYTVGFFTGTANFDPGPGTFNITSAGQEDIFVSKLIETTAGVLTTSGTAINTTESATFTGTVASFTDTDGDPASNYTATIDWGDGTNPDTNVSVSPNASGGFDVSGKHTYAEEGSYTITVGITDSDGSTATATSTATVADVPLTANGQDVLSTEGQTFTDVVASFTDFNPIATSGDFTASIDWGDGNISSGMVSANASGGFDVIGTNTYLEEGTYAISVVITDLGGSTATTGSTATIDDAILTATAASVSAAEGAEFSDVVASFTDADPNAMNSDFTATIDWGDGNVSDGLITANDSGGFDIIGTNTYAEEGSYPVSVSIADVGGSTASASGMATVGDAPLSATPMPVNATEGAAFTGPVATFTDVNAFSDINDLSATITWGDGHASAGTLAAIGPNTYTVSGTNTYAEEGSYLVSVQIKDQGGSVASTNSQATVADAPLPATFKKFSPIEGAPFTGVVATFRDTDPNGTLSDYVATITWGDGHASAGKITPTTGAGFNVTGSNTYGEEGSFAVSVTIRDMGGSTASVGGLVKVVDAGLAVVQTSAVTATAGRSFSGRLLTFIDADPNGVVPDYTASIDWGDGHKSSGTIATNGAGGFDVTGTNTYLRTGTYTIKVLIADGGGSNVSARTTATVSAALAANLSPLSRGAPAFDSNQAALAAVMAEWSSQHNYATRIGNLVGTGSGTSFTNRLNGNYFLQPGVTVFDDGAQDQLSGSAGQDWFFANIFGPGVLDKITGLAKDEIVTDI